MQNTVTFASCMPKRNIYNDNLECWFKFSVVDSSLIGTPREVGSTHIVKVTIVDVLMNRWNLAGAGWSGITEDMIKVAYQSAEDHISDQLRKGPLSERELPSLFMSTEDFPSSCPYNIANIHYPEKTTFEVTIDDRIDQPQELDQARGIPRAAILTVLPVEYKAVRAHLTDLQEETHPKGTVYERGRFSSTTHSWEVGIVEIGEGNPSAAMEVERAIQHFKPNVVLFVGVAGGIKDVQLGDVVAATKAYGYESGKDKVTFETRPDIGYSTYPMEQRARAEAKKKSWLQRIERPSSDSDSAPCALVGPIAAGAKVVASIRSETYKFLRTQYSDALAVEMEGHGFLTAAHASSGVEALVVRGISDLIKGKSRTDAEGWQEIAAQNASAFAFEVLANMMISAEPSTEDSENLPQLSFSTDIDFSPPTPAEKQAGVKRSWFIKLRIENTGRTVAANCFGRLLRILDKEGHHLKRFDSLYLYWTRQDRPDNYQPLDIRESGDFTYLDIAQVKEAENALVPRVVIPDRQRLPDPPGHMGKPEYLPPGTYYMQIAVYADNASIEPTWFKVEWKDDYTIEPYPCSIEVEDPAPPSNSLPIRPIFQITDKYFTADSDPQKIVIRFTNLGERTIRVRKVLYSDTGLGLPDAALLSTYKKAERGRLIIPFNKSKAIIQSGQHFTVELELGQIWKPEDINRWSGDWGYLSIYVSYEDSTEEIDEFYSI